MAQGQAPGREQTRSRLGRGPRRDLPDEYDQVEGGSMSNDRELNRHLCDCQTISLRDYFIAHAPENPQPWFSPVMPAPPKSFGVPNNLTKKEMRQIDALMAGALGINEINEPRVKEWAVAFNAYKKAEIEHSMESQKQRYIQWPAAWADAILSQRGDSA